MWTVRYLAHNGLAREAHIALPGDLGPANNPPVPLIISPHGRGITGRANLSFWGNLPARGRFAVISPEGHGRVLPLHSWGWERQIDDLANMQYVAKATLPVAPDPAAQRLRDGRQHGRPGDAAARRSLQHPPGRSSRARLADGSRAAVPRLRAPLQRPFAPGAGTARGRRRAGEHPGAYARRSPINYARAIAFSRVPLQMYWSLADEVVLDQAHNSALLYPADQGAEPRGTGHRRRRELDALRRYGGQPSRRAAPLRSAAAGV